MIELAFLFCAYSAAITLVFIVAGVLAHLFHDQIEAVVSRLIR